MQAARKLPQAQTQQPEPQTGVMVLDHGPGEYLIYMKWGGVLRTIRWNASEPLPLDHPATHFLVKKGDIIKLLRRVSANSDKAETVCFFNEPERIGKAGDWLDAGSLSGRPLAIRFARLVRARAAYLPMISGPTDISSEGAVYASCGVHAFLSAFETLPQRGTFAGQIERHRAFAIQRTTKAVYLTAILPGLKVKLKGRDPFTMNPLTRVVITNMDLQSAKITLGDYWWRFNRLAAPVFSRHDQKDERSEEFYSFRRSLIGTLVITGLMGLVGSLMPAPKPKVEDLLKEATTIHLKKPHQLAVVPQPTPKPTPTPTPTPTPKKVVEKKPEPPKKLEPKKTAPPKKVAEKKPAPKKPEPKREVRKPIAKRPAPPRPVVAPPKQPVAKTPPPPPAVTRPATKPVSAPVAAAPRPEPKAPPAPSPEQIKAAQAEQARAQIAKSLGFLATTPSKSAPARTATAEPTNNDAKYASMERSTAPIEGKTSALSHLASSTTVTGNGAIQTKGSRSISSDAGVKGSGKALNEVQGRVTLAGLYSPGGSGGSSLGGTSGLSIGGKGSLEEALLLKTLQKYLQRFQYCYEKALLSKPTLGGTLTMEWTIQGSGSASGIRVTRSELNHNPLHQCVSKELGKISFPAPKGGSVIVKYPFSFSSSAL